jgi:hypothetical protein
MTAGKFGPRVNVYTCRKCRKETWTVDVDEGVTPFMLGCRATKGCDGMAESSFYPGWAGAFLHRVKWEWYKPTEEEAKQQERQYPGSLHHWEQGGLSIRPRTDAEPVRHEAAA